MRETFHKMIQESRDQQKSREEDRLNEIKKLKEQIANMNSEGTQFENDLKAKEK